MFLSQSEELLTCRGCLEMSKLSGEQPGSSVPKDPNCFSSTF